MSTYLLSIDQGTSSSRAILFTRDGDVHALAQKELKLTYPHDGWVEQNPQALVDNTLWAVQNVIAKAGIDASDIAGVGISNQRETTIVWDRKTGQPVYDAIVWQDRRTAEYCATLKRENLEDTIRQKTGLLLDPYFSATKVKWILDHVDGARTRAENGDLLFGTVDSYLLWHLTKGAVHATDITNASRTMLYNIIGQNWDKDLLKLFSIPESMLPIVCDNAFDYGRIDSDIIGGGLTIGGMAGDQQAALIGQGCIKPGMVKSTYGTGCFALVNMGSTPTISEHRLLTTIGYKIGDHLHYALEGSIFNAGTAIQFLRDNLNFFDDAKTTQDMAVTVEDTGGVYFVPAFTGLGAPYWNPDARGVICGLTRDTSKAHIVRAALEAQGYQTRDLLSAMQKDSGQPIDVLRVDGGLVANDFMCSFLSDILGATIEIPKVLESTAWGAACLAGVQSGVFENLEDSASVWRSDKTYRPSAPKEAMDKKYKAWQRAVEKSY